MQAQQGCLTLHCCCLKMTRTASMPAKRTAKPCWPGEHHSLWLAKMCRMLRPAAMCAQAPSNLRQLTRQNSAWADRSASIVAVWCLACAVKKLRAGGCPQNSAPAAACQKRVMLTHAQNNPPCAQSGCAPTPLAALAMPRCMKQQKGIKWCLSARQYVHKTPPTRGSSKAVASSVALARAAAAAADGARSGINPLDRELSSAMPPVCTAKTRAPPPWPLFSA